MKKAPSARVATMSVMQHKTSLKRLEDTLETSLKSCNRRGGKSHYGEKKLDMLEGGNNNLLEQDGYKWWGKCDNTGSGQ